MKTIDELTDIGRKATKKFNQRMPIHGSAVTLEWWPSFSSTEACAAFAEAVRDAVLLDSNTEINRLRDIIGKLNQQIDDLSSDKCESPTTPVDYRESIVQHLANTPTLRDQFAMAALSGLVFHNDYGTVSDENIANGAWRYADAMIAAREVKT